MQKEFTDNSNYYMALIGSNVFYLSYLDDSEIDVEKIEEIVSNGFKLHGTKPFYSIIDFRDNFASMSPEAKKYLANQDRLNDLRICEVILVNTLAMKLIVSGYFRLYRPKWPLKVVRKESELYPWLEKQNLISEDLQNIKNFLNKTEAKAS